MTGDSQIIESIIELKDFFGKYPRIYILLSTIQRAIRITYSKNIPLDKMIHTHVQYKWFFWLFN